jgi:hypothetical protein
MSGVTASGAPHNKTQNAIFCDFLNSIQKVLYLKYMATMTA